MRSITWKAIQTKQNKKRNREGTLLGDIIFGTVIFLFGIVAVLQIVLYLKTI